MPGIFFVSISISSIPAILNLKPFSFGKNIFAPGFDCLKELSISGKKILSIPSLRPNL
jgi:hypothetical protein